MTKKFFKPTIIILSLFFITSCANNLKLETNVNEKSNLHEEKLNKYMKNRVDDLQSILLKSQKSSVEFIIRDVEIVGNLIKINYSIIPPQNIYVVDYERMDEKECEHSFKDKFVDSNKLYYVLHQFSATCKPFSLQPVPTSWIYKKLLANTEYDFELNLLKDSFDDLIYKEGFNNINEFYILLGYITEQEVKYNTDHFKILGDEISVQSLPNFNKIQNYTLFNEKFVF